MNHLANFLWLLFLGFVTVFYTAISLEDRKRRKWHLMLIDIAIAIMALLILCEAATAQGMPAPPPRLIVWTDPTCANCRQFWDDFHAGLGAELAAKGWQVDRYEIRRRPLQAWALGVMEVPCFVKPGERRYWYGYRPGEFRDIFGLVSPEAAQTPPAVPTAPSTFSVDELQQFLQIQLRDQRIEFEQQLAEQTSADEARQQSLAQALAQQQGVIDSLRGGDPAVNERLDRISAVLYGLAQQQQGDSAQPSGDPPAEVSPRPPPESPTESTGLAAKLRAFLLKLGMWELAGVFGVSTLAVSGGATLAIPIAGWLWKHRPWRNRSAPSTPSPTSPAPPVNCRTCSQLREQIGHLEQLITDLRENPLRVDDSVERFQRAMQMVAHQYPSDQSFARWKKLVLQHFKLISSGDGVAPHA